jgi:hypothetical protein
MNKNMVDLLVRSLEAERDRISEAILELKGQLPKSGQRGAEGFRRADAAAGGGEAPSSSKPKRTMSAAAKRKISEAMKRRYAELRKAAAKR